MKTAYIRFAAAVLAVVMLFGMCSCASGLFAGKGVTVNIVNEVPDRLTSIQAAFYLESARATKLYSNGSVDSFLEAKTYTFTLPKKDIENDEDLKTLSVRITVAENNWEKNVKNIDIKTFQIPSEYGDSYTFILRFENGEYVLTQESGVSDSISRTQS